MGILNINHRNLFFNRCNQRAQYIFGLSLSSLFKPFKKVFNRSAECAKITPANVRKLSQENFLTSYEPELCREISGFRWRRFIRGQSLIEYSVLIVCIVLALLAMQAYLKRGIQGKLRESADQIGAQYEPTKTSSDFTISSKSSVTTVSTLTIDEDSDSTNATTVVTTNYDEQARKGKETVGAYK